MKKRHPAAVLLLPIVTLGIYCVYWLYATRRELLARTGNNNAIPSVFILFLPFILLVGLVIAGALASGDASLAPGEADAETSLGVVSVISIILIIGFFIGGIFVLPLWWFWKYCKAVVAVTGNKGMDFTQLYVLYVAIVWLCGVAPVWMLITQLDFNKIADGNDTDHPTSGHHSTAKALPAA